MSKPDLVKFYPLPEIPRRNVIMLAHMTVPDEYDEKFERLLISLYRQFDAAAKAGSDFGNAIGIAIEAVVMVDGFHYRPDDQEWCKAEFYNEVS